MPSRNQLYLIRMGAVLLLLATGYVLLTRHMYRLQVVRHEELHQKARRRYTASRTEIGQRGRILDFSGNLLAGNLACRDILAEPGRFTSERNTLITVLGQELDVDPGRLEARFAMTDGPGRRPVEVVVKRGVDMRKAEQVAAYRFHGLRFVDTYQRNYPKGGLLANLIGFVDASGQGVTGIEQQYDAVLSPTVGTAVYERDRKGNNIETGAELAPQNGVDVYLTLQEPIQHLVESELQNLVKQFRPRAAYAVMVNPRTGALMALAQYPSFNPNEREQMNPSHWRNRAISDGFEPGSILKGPAIAGALDYGLVTLDTVFDCERGYWIYYRRPLRDTRAYDELTVREIIQKSSNIGTAKIALAMGENRLYQTLTRFGLGSRTGIGIDQEATGILRPVHRWDGLSITRFPIGQGVLMTPLQIVQAYCALANDGLIMQIRAVDRIVSPDGHVLRTFPPQVKGRAVRPHAAREMVSALKLVTTDEGTGSKAAVEGYSVAGKTGTAQKVLDGQYSHRKYVATFIGFVPADAPEFVLLVAADEPTQGGYYGGTVAAPTFSRIAEKTLRYLQVAPGTETLASLTPATEEALHEQEAVVR